jgi:hypothetical protein
LHQAQSDHHQLIEELRDREATFSATNKKIEQMGEEES